MKKAMPVPMAAAPLPPDDGGPLVAFRSRIASGDMTFDPIQELAAARLQALHAALSAHNHAAARTMWHGRLGLSRRAGATPRGLYLVGGVGRGKSMLMDLFFAASPVAAKRRVHFHAFMLEAHARMHKWRQKNLQDREGKDPIAPLARKIAEESRLLCFDEFQVTNIADAMILGRLFEQLFALGVVVVATSNTAPDDLYRNGLQRERFLPFIELIKRRLDVVRLDGDRDYRRDRILTMPIYHTPLGPAAASALDAAFFKLTDDEPGQRVEIAVQGRTLIVPHAARGVARMSFADLCSKPLGAADYLALAGSFPTVVIDDIPLLDADRRNEARRFITLIDALYEHRTKLICAAAAPPDRLYPSGDGAVDFRRTASRLMEMQSVDYLALRHLPREPTE